jgi:UDP-N-acetylmuramate--alanine ligase
VEHAPGVDAMLDRVQAELRPGDMVITMGAGDIYRAGEKLLVRLRDGAGRKE